MIRMMNGNILDADVEALVNTVNCMGYMGRGIALQFKKAFPPNFTAYQQACREGSVRPGRVFVFETGSIINPRYIINFPTKRHWREKSRLQYIDSGLESLLRELKKRKIRSIAIPPLGSGLGGLDWNAVRQRIEEAFSNAPNVRVLIYAPAGAPDPKEMPVRTKRPRMTIARALFIKLMQQYTQLAYRLTLLEIQKLAYFLQEAGEPLRLRYDAGHYGPYAHNLNKVLEELEGHFIRGYGDSQKPDVEISLKRGAVRTADAFLTEHPNSRERLERIARLIEGFETPYGMELLSSVHWVTAHSGDNIRNGREAVEAVHMWNQRKRDMFRREHISIAWNRLTELGWTTRA